MTADRSILEGFFVNSKLLLPHQAVEIAAHFQEKMISKNELHLCAGSICNEYMFLEKGYMRAYTNDTAGKEVTTLFYTPGEVVFEVSSFFNRYVSKENIQATTDCRIWSITYDQLNMLFHGMPEFREFGRVLLVKGFINLKQQMLSMVADTAEERYLQLLRTQPEILLNNSLKNVASYLGVSDTTLSRIRKDYSHR